MTEKKTQYELRRRSKNYVGLWFGDQCLAGICTNTTRRRLNAQFLVKACNAYESIPCEKEQAV